MTKKYIDADAFISEKRELYCKDCNMRKNSKGKICYEIGDAACKSCGINDMLDEIEDYPAADVEQVKHGKWIKVPSATHKDIYFYDCSICKASIHSKTDSGLYSAIEWNGGINLCCPYCGAKMDGKEIEK